VTVDFDTGSAALFLPGPSCSNCVGHHIYNPTQSSTAKDLGSNSTVDYGKGEVKGELFTDNVSAGGFEVSANWPTVAVPG
jgi:cathepsin D